MRQRDKGCGKEEILMRELTETDLANIYGGAKGGYSNPGVTGIPDLSGLHLPYGMTMPNLSNLPKATPSSSSGNNPSTGQGTSNAASNSLPALASLLGLPI